MSLHLRFKSRFTSQALLPLYNSPLHITATLSLSFLSFSRRTPSIRSQLQTKRRFPSQHLNKSIYATSHAYQTCQLTNGGQVKQREFCIKDHVSNQRFIQHRHPAEDTSTRIIQANIIRKPATISRKTEQQQYQEGPVRSQHIKTDTQFRIRRSNLVGDNRKE